MIQHEYYREVLASETESRDVEMDAREAQGAPEKCYTDEDMWRVHEK